MRTNYQWREQGYAEDLATADITEQTDDAQALALAAMVDGYATEYRRLGGVVIYAVR